MAKLKETKKQLEAMETIEESVKLLKKLADFYEKPLQPDIIIKTAAADGAKSQQLVIHLTEEKVKQIIQSVAQPASLDVLTLSKKCSIELDDEEQLLADYFKPVKAARKKTADLDAGDTEASEETEVEEEVSLADAE